MIKSFWISGSVYDTFISIKDAIIKEGKQVLQKCGAGEVLSCIDIEAHCVFSGAEDTNGVIHVNISNDCAYDSKTMNEPEQLGEMGITITETIIAIVKQIVEHNLPNVMAENSWDTIDNEMAISFVTNFHVKTNGGTHSSGTHYCIDFKNLDDLKAHAGDELGI